MLELHREISSGFGIAHIAFIKRNQENLLSNLFANKTKENTASGSYNPWLICLSAGLFFFYEFFQLNVFDVINQDLRQSFALDAGKISLMSSTFVWANVLFLLPAGIILDSYKVKNIIVSALIVCIIGTLGFSLSKNYTYAAIFHAFTGIGNAFCFLSCVILVTRWFPPKNQALVIGLIVTMAFLGGMVAHTPFAWLNSRVGWRSAVLIDAIFGMLILIWICIFVKDKCQEKVSNSHKSDKWTNKFIHSLQNKQNWFAGIYTSCLNLPIMVLCALWGGSYLINIHHLNTIKASNIISLIFVGSIIGCPVLGWLSDKHGKRKPTMIFGALITFILFIPLFLSISLSETVLSFIFFSLGFITSAQVISYPLIAESNPTSNTGIATGIASIIIMSGGGVGQVLFGLIMDNGSINSQYLAVNYQHAMLIFPITALIALIAAFFMKETFAGSTRY